MDGFTYEGIGAAIAIMTALFAVYNSGVQRGKVEGRILSMENKIAGLEARNEKANEELNSRISRLDERIDLRLQNIANEISNFMRAQIKGLGL